MYVMHNCTCTCTYITSIQCTCTCAWFPSNCYLFRYVGDGVRKRYHSALRSLEMAVDRIAIVTTSLADSNVTRSAVSCDMHTTSAHQHAHTTSAHQRVHTHIIIMRVNITMFFYLVRRLPWKQSYMKRCR